MELHNRRHVYSSPAVSDGVVYIGSVDKKVYALDAATGALKWNYTTGGYIGSSPAVCSGVVYIGSDDMKVYAFACARPPSIASIVLSPQGPTPDSQVSVSATITDLSYGVKMISLHYSTDGGSTWTILPMSLSTGSTYTAIIPKQTDGTTVQYKIKVEDNAGNIVESNIASYTVHAPTPAIPGFPIEASIIGIVMAVATLTLLKRKKLTIIPTKCKVEFES